MASFPSRRSRIWRLSAERSGGGWSLDASLSPSERASRALSVFHPPRDDSDLTMTSLTSSRVLTIVNESTPPASRRVSTLEPAPSASGITSTSGARGSCVEPLGSDVTCAPSMFARTPGLISPDLTTTTTSSVSSAQAYLSTGRVALVSDVWARSVSGTSSGSRRRGGMRLMPRAASRRAILVSTSGSGRVSSFWTKSIAPCVMWLPTKFVVAPESGFSYPGATVSAVPSGFCSRAS